MNGDFTPEQKRYLEGFTSGLQIARAGRGAAPSPPSGAAAPPAPSALQAGGGCGMQLGHYSATGTPHWEIFGEPQARRIEALDNGTHKAFLAGVSDKFDRPK